MYINLFWKGSWSELSRLHLISGYARSFNDLLLGKSDEAVGKLMGGARIHHIFHRVFAKVRVAMRNAAGPKPQLFVPEMAFERMVKRQIQKLEEPAMQCVSMVFEELKHLAAQSGSLQRFPSTWTHSFQGPRPVFWSL